MTGRRHATSGLDPATGLRWSQLHSSRAAETSRAEDVLRQWATDQRTPRLVLELRACASGTVYLIGTPPDAGAQRLATLEALVPTMRAVAMTDARASVQAAASLRASTRHRPLRTVDPVAVVRAVLASTVSIRGSELLVIQLVLGPGRVPLAIPNRTAASVVSPWWQTAWIGDGGTLDGEKRTALRDKTADHGFACAIRIGVTAPDRARRRSLLLGVLAAFKTAEAAGVRLRLVAERPHRLDHAVSPWRWPLRLNVHELVGFTGWPLDANLPGQPPQHPVQLPPAPGVTGTERIVAAASAPGASGTLALRAVDAVHHTLCIGPTGSGKSVLTTQLIVQDVADGRAVFVMEPKGDVVDDVLRRIPRHRRDDVVVLDPTDCSPVGLNPLTAAGRRPEVVADSLLAIFRHLYGEAIGPRSGDILYAATLTLARRRDASLVMLPLLLTNPGFRRSIISDLRDPIALEPFWAAFNAWSDAERSQAIAPLMNKLRPFLLRQNLRAVLGQREPQFSLRQVFTERKILLVPLRQGVMGSEAASLLGSLLVSELWQATQERASVPPSQRHPVMVYIDEAQNYLNLGIDLSDALAQARGYGTAFHLSHQYLDQLDRTMRRAVLTNTRSRIVFQTEHSDAAAFAKGHPEVAAEDFTALGRFEVYASLFSHGQVTPYASGRTVPLGPATSKPAELRALSRRRYGRPLTEIEAGFAQLMADHDSPAAQRARPAYPSTPPPGETPNATGTARPTDNRGDDGDHGVGRRPRRPA
jgi:hypothetical protein